MDDCWAKNEATFVYRRQKEIKARSAAFKEAEKIIHFHPPEKSLRASWLHD
jgi:hypothetical protein